MWRTNIRPVFKWLFVIREVGRLPADEIKTLFMVTITTFTRPDTFALIDKKTESL